MAANGGTFCSAHYVTKHCDFSTNVNTVHSAVLTAHTAAQCTAVAAAHWSAHRCTFAPPGSQRAAHESAELPAQRATKQLAFSAAFRCTHWRALDSTFLCPLYTALSAALQLAVVAAQFTPYLQTVGAALEPAHLPAHCCALVDALTRRGNRRHLVVSGHGQVRSARLGAY